MKKGFTLAEVLITLGIIGVIAAMTLPILITKYKEHVFLNQFKASYSVLQQAYTRIIAEEGDYTNWPGVEVNGLYVPQINADMVYEKFVPYLNVTEKCFRTEGCFPTEKYKTFNLADNYCGNGTPYSKVLIPKVRLANGMSVAFKGNSIMFDTNGDKGPNRHGFDVFTIGFYPAKPTILQGAGLEHWIYDAGLAFCSLTQTACYNMFSGYSCSWWVLRAGNMDYMHRNLTGKEWRQYLKPWHY